MANMDIAEKRKPQDGRITIRVGGNRRLTFGQLISVTSRKRGVMEKVVTRIWIQRKTISTGRYGDQPKTLSWLREGIDAQRNYLCYGPTGSGIDDPLRLLRETQYRCHISTMEDPV